MKLYPVPLTFTWAMVAVEPREFVTVRLMVCLLPTATEPKSIVPGLTATCAASAIGVGVGPGAVPLFPPQPVAAVSIVKMEASRKIE